MIIDQRELFLFASVAAGWYDKDNFHHTIQRFKASNTVFGKSLRLKKGSQAPAHSLLCSTKERSDEGNSICNTWSP